jgi:hypothetical protein
MVIDGWERDVVYYDAVSRFCNIDISTHYKVVNGVTYLLSGDRWIAINSGEKGDGNN